jgi:hypothetical protein
MTEWIQLFFSYVADIFVAIAEFIGFVDSTPK